MLPRVFILAIIIAVTMPSLALAQAADSPRTPDRSTGKWRTPRKGVLPPTTGRPAASKEIKQTSGQSDDGVAPLNSYAPPAAAPAPSASRQPIARVTEGSGGLPNDAGQVWREYDITPYTVRVTTTNSPEQAIVDWILRDTGYETWHSEPFAFLSANRRSLRVYHTPEMQGRVQDVVDRFVNTEAETSAFSVRVITIAHPDWRIKAKQMLRPVAVQTQGIQAWLVEKEDAALLLAELRKRNDFREHSSPQLLVNNGQSTTVAATRPKTYTRDITLHPNAWPAYEAELGQFDEGFSLELSPLLSLDGQTIDAVIKCHIDQLEKLVPVMMDVPSPVSSHQRVKVEVPQITHCRLHERFRWPTGQILLVGLGVVPTPVPNDPALKVPLPWPSAAARADLLVLVESKGKAGDNAPVPVITTQRDTRTYHGRY
ncbi:MAG TPA: hypothetical protein VHD36_24160 [Pirellulales bacterium]|nr:hypothetical protein [Pirellulales bacterium]